MNYQRIYNEIVAKRVDNTPIGYYENHHIIPRSLGGLDEASNIVKLTAREHFLCHWLLVKIHRLDIYNHARMLRAFSMMCFTASDNQQRVNNSRTFEKYRTDFSKMMAVSQIGEQNSQFGTMWIHNTLSGESSKVKKTDPIPQGWSIGRVSIAKKQCPICKALFAGTTTYCGNSCKEEGKKLKKQYIPDDIAISMLHDYENGMPMKDMLHKYNRKSEQSVSSFLRKRFPNRKTFSPKKREISP